MCLMLPHHTVQRAGRDNSFLLAAMSARDKASCVIGAVRVQVAREIQIHSALVHDHIIALYGAFEDGKHVYLVQEFAPGAPRYRASLEPPASPSVQPAARQLRLSPENCTAADA